MYLPTTQGEAMLASLQDNRVTRVGANGTAHATRHGPATTCWLLEGERGPCLNTEGGGPNVSATSRAREDWDALRSASVFGPPRTDTGGGQGGDASSYESPHDRAVVTSVEEDGDTAGVSGNRCLEASESPSWPPRAKARDNH